MCVRSAKVSRKGKEGMSETGLKKEIHKKWESSKVGKVGECTTPSPQWVVTFTLRMQENPNIATLLHQVLGEKRVRKYCPGTSRSTTRHRGTNSSNLVPTFPQRDTSHWAGEIYKSFPGKGFIQLQNFAVF